MLDWTGGLNWWTGLVDWRFVGNIYVAIVNLCSGSLIMLLYSTTNMTRGILHVADDEWNKK